MLDLCGLQRVHRPGLHRDQQPKCRVQRARVALGPGRGEQALRPAGRFGCQYRRALQECGRRGQSPTALGPARRALKLPGDLLVRPGGGLRPGATRADPDQPLDR